MKKLLQLKTMLLLCALIVGSSSVWADTVTFAYADYKGNGTTSSGSQYTMEKEDVSIGDTKFWGNNNYAHFYANSISTITPASGVTITGIELTASATGYNGYQSSGKVTASTGTVSGSTSSTTVTWSGSATSAFTITHDKQIRWTSIVVTYTKSASSTWSVTYSSNGATSGIVPTDATEYDEDNNTVTVLGNTGSLVKTGYSFGGWNTKSDGSGLGYVAGDSFTITGNTTLYAKWNDYASLPFAFDGGKSDIDAAVGLSHSGLGSDYGSSPKLKFDTEGDYLILKFNEAPGILTFDIKGNSFSGGTFKVQASDDGVSYSDVTSYTTLGDTQSETLKSLASTVRYIKWIYTTKSSGNVALGNISLSSIVPTISVTPSSSETFTYEVDEGPSADQMFEVTGTHLTTDITASITGDFEMTDDSSYGTADLILSSGDVVSIRLKAGLTKGDYEGSLTFSSTGASNVVISLNGTVTNPSSSAAFANTTPSINYPAVTTYQQLATTATGYTGTVIYEIVTNTAGASIEGSTVTVTQVGSVTVKATAPAITGWTASEATYTLTVIDTRSNCGLAYSEDSQEVTVGEILDAPTLTNPNGLAVTYESDNEEIATVDEDGNVTGVAVGSTIITARFAGNSSFKPGSASYTITVNEAPFVITDGVFDFTEDEDYGSGLAKSGVKAQTSTWTAVSVTMYMTGRNCWYNGTPTQVRLYKASGGDAAGSITLSVPTGFVITNIAFTGASFDKMSAAKGTYSYADDKKSAEWEGEANSITFTASDRTDINTINVTYAAPVIITSAEYATYCNTTKALDFSETGITVYTATDNTTFVRLNEVVSGQVPANTPVVLYKMGADGSAIDVPVIASADPVGSNDLSVVGTGGLSGEDGVYVLAKKANGVGFYLWDKSVSLNEGKVCLRTGGTTAREFLGFDIEDEPTAISEVRGQKSEVRGEFFNLNGQRVVQPSKGLYIVNGRKVVLK